MRIAAPLTVVALLTAACSGSTAQQPPATPAVEAVATPGIAVTGQGEVEGTPDTMRATVGVEVSRPSVQEALDEANAAAQQVITALRDAGVAEEDIQTRDLAVEPRFAPPPPQGGGTPEIEGYTVRNLVEATVRDIDRVGDVLGAAVQAGGDAARLRGVSFSLEDDEELLAAARERAFAEARGTAEQYAELAGRELGAVVSVQETLGGIPPPPPRPVGLEAAEDVAAPIPVQPGTQRVTVTVTVVWAFA